MNRSVMALLSLTLFVGTVTATEPMHFLKQNGVDLDALKIVSMEDELDNEGNPCASPQHVLQAPSRF